ncbi:MAG: oxidoreductase [Bacteroidota bacterium]
MMKKRISVIWISILLISAPTLFAQKILFVDSSQSTVSFRGLSVVNDNVLWVSGSKGTIGKSIDGGRTFTWMHPAGFEKRDFRDIEAFDANTAVAMAIDSPAFIIKTTDGGVTWKTVYERHLHGIFLDAMCFKNDKRGVCVGDPINLRFWLLETNDGGDSWQEIPPPFRPTADSGEACFASSGTNLQFVDDTRFEYGFVSGGAMSILYLMGNGRTKPSAKIALEINHELESTGANSWAVNGKKYVVVGGDFKDYKMEMYNSAYSMDAGRRWQSPAEPPAGYKSCVIWKDNINLIATGLAGTDISFRGPKAWKHISDIQFHVVQKAKTGNSIFLAGGGGRIGRYVE